MDNIVFIIIIDYTYRSQQAIPLLLSLLVALKWQLYC